MYCTSIIYPSGRANTVQVLAMAKELSRQLRGEFYLAAGKVHIENCGFGIINFGSMPSYRLAWQQLQFARSKKINHIFAREPRLLFFLIWLNKIFFRLDLKFIYEVHTIFSHGFLGALVEKSLARRSNLLVFVTRALRKDYLSRYHPRPDRTMVEPDAVDLGIFGQPTSKQEARFKLNLPLDKFIIGYTGRFKTMSMDKGLNDALRALTLLDDRFILLAVGGRPRDVDEYKAQARELGVGERAIIRDHTTQDAIALYQQSSNVLIMPFPSNQHFAYYMSPLKMFEYMAARRPIIASDLPSVREVLNDKNALLTSPGDPGALAASVIELVDNEVLVEKLTKQAYQDVKNYTWENRVKRILTKLT